MRVIEVRLTVPESELLDAAEDVERLLDQAAEDDLSPPLRDVLLALDDAITDSLCDREVARGSTVSG